MSIHIAVTHSMRDGLALTIARRQPGYARGTWLHLAGAWRILGPPSAGPAEAEHRGVTSMEETVWIESDGLKLSGVIHLPPDLRSGDRRPTFLVLHGFGGNKEGGGSVWPAKQLAEWGYVAIR